MNDHYNSDVARVRNALGNCYSQIEDRPSLRNRIMCEIKGEGSVKKKLSIGLVLAIVTLLAMMTVAIAGIITAKSYQITTYDQVTVYDLVPQQLYIGNGVVHLESGYLRGGYEVDEDCISAMEKNSTLAFFNASLEPQWEITDSRLIGCLFTQVKEANGFIYLGKEATASEEWSPALMKVSIIDGQIAWFYQGERDMVITDFALMDDCVIGVGYKAEVSTGRRLGCIFKIDADGNYVWEKQADNISAFNAAYAQEDRLIAIGREQDNNSAYLILYDGQGNLIESQPLDVDIPVGSSIRIQKTYSGKIIAFINASNNELASTDTNYIVLSE
ncbi:MAG: hypothetical protein GX096_01070 [Clostridiales bacterium]|nr:hypothetical protein [Clostridiales bacterium]